jgi:ubiquinone/menaquinone biosynthesis C-methylase UbiE
MKEEKDFKFDKRATSYDDGFEGKLSRRFYNLLIQNVEFIEGMNLLDVGCGTGTLLKKFSGVCKINGFGIDMEENMIAEAKKKCPKMKIKIAKSEETGFENNQFDVITACMAYHHFFDKIGFANEAARILKHGGYLYIADPNFPLIIRKPLNGILKLLKITGFFGTAEEIYINFKELGFELCDVKKDKYAQVVKMKLVRCN